MCSVCVRLYRSKFKSLSAILLLELTLERYVFADIYYKTFVWNEILHNRIEWLYSGCFMGQNGCAFQARRISRS